MKTKNRASKEPSLCSEMTEQNKTSSGFNLDAILKELGSFGRYQILMLLLLAFRDTFLTMCNHNYMFTTAHVEYRCKVSECESDLRTLDHGWLSHALPDNDTQCHRFHYNDNSSKPEETTSEEKSLHRCTAECFEKGLLVECDQWIYADNTSVVAEFNLGCQEWKRVLIGTAHNVGLLVSLILSGIISDRYGRKTIIVASPLVVGTVGLAKSFSPDYWVLVVLEFVEAALGYGTASLVLSLECVSHDKRVIFASTLSILESFGGAFLGLIAWGFPYWRTLLRIIYTPLFVVFFYVFLLDEGVRWLLAKGRKEEAIKILNKVAKINKVTLSNVAQDMMGNNECNNDNKIEGKSQLALITSLKSKSIWYSLITCSLCQLCATFIYTGILVNSANSNENSYLSYSLAMLVSIPTRAMTAIILSRWGRKVPMAISMFLCAIFMVSTGLVPKDWHWCSMSLTLCGKMAVSFGLYTLTVYTLECFPTCTRNSLANISCTVGKLGAVFAPQSQLLTVYLHSLPNLAFGTLALLAGCVMFMMPDTSDKQLPDDVAEVEATDDARKDDKSVACTC